LLKSWTPVVDRAIIGETVFTYVYIENILKNLLKKNHCARKTEIYMNA
jgi:hypothetical protein